MAASGVAGGSRRGMRRRSSTTSPRGSSRKGACFAVLVLTAPLLTACEPKVYGPPPAPPEAPALTGTYPRDGRTPLSEFPADLPERVGRATACAARAGAPMRRPPLERRN